MWGGRGVARIVVGCVGDTHTELQLGKLEDADGAKPYHVRSFDRQRGHMLPNLRKSSSPHFFHSHVLYACWKSSAKVAVGVPTIGSKQYSNILSAE